MLALCGEGWFAADSVCFAGVASRGIDIGLCLPIVAEAHRGGGCMAMFCISSGVSAADISAERKRGSSKTGVDISSDRGNAGVSASVPQDYDKTSGQLSQF